MDKKIKISLGSALEEIGYSANPEIIQQLKNKSMFHKMRRKMYEGRLPSTVAEIDVKYEKIVKKYDFLLMGFWSVFPVLFSSIDWEDLKKQGVREFIKQYNRDIFEFRPYTAKCILKVTIWPRVEILSHPFGYLLILIDGKVNTDEVFNSFKNEWESLDGYDRFGVLPPLFMMIDDKKILSPLTRTKFTKYPPSIKYLEERLFKP